MYFNTQNKQNGMDQLCVQEWANKRCTQISRQIRVPHYGKLSHTEEIHSISKEILCYSSVQDEQWITIITAILQIWTLISSQNWKMRSAHSVPHGVISNAHIFPPKTKSRSTYMALWQWTEVQCWAEEYWDLESLLVCSWPSSCLP